jgi:hypothetical protein
MSTLINGIPAEYYAIAKTINEDHNKRQKFDSREGDLEQALATMRRLFPPLPTK